MVETSNYVKLDTTNLAKYSYNPSKLLNYCLESRPPSQELEILHLRPLFEKILLRAMANIAAIAPELPNWEHSNWQETFHRFDVINERLLSLITLWERKNESKPSDFERVYLQLLEKKYQKIEMRGLGSIGEILSLSLDTIFVPLRFTNLADKKAIHRLDELEPTATYFDFLSRVSMKSASSDSVSIIEILDKASKVILVGDPGSGKTTIIHYLALAAIRKEPYLGKSAGRHLVPFVFYVRSFDDFSRLPTPRRFIEYCAPVLDNSNAEAFVTHILSEGRGLILIDGIDECIVPNRDEQNKNSDSSYQTEWGHLINWISEISAAYPKNCFIITSRPVGYTTGVLKDSGFAEYKLLPLSMDEQEKFIFNWCRAAESATIDAPEISEMRANIQAVDLQQRIKRSASIQLFAQTPLMLSVICIVHRYQGKRLPERRVELLRECTNVLLFEWRKSQGIRESVIGDLDATNLRALLEPLAWHMLKEKRAQVDQNFVEEIFRRYLPSISENPERAIERIGTIRDRTGLLYEASPGTYAFAHLIIQEYLAAEESNRHGYDVLLENVKESAWQEVIPLAVGANRGSQEMIIRALVHQGEAVLAGRSLAASDRISPTIRTEVLNYLENQLYNNNEWTGIGKALMEIGGNEVAQLCWRLQEHINQVPYLEGVEKNAKAKVTGTPDIEEFATSVAYRCLFSTQLQVTKVHKFADEPPFFVLRYISHNSAVSSATWDSGSMLFGMQSIANPQRLWSLDEQNYALPWTLDILTALGESTWNVFLPLSTDYSLTPETRMRALIAVSEAISLKHISTLLEALEMFPSAVYPALQIGLLNRLAFRFNSSINNLVASQMRKLWAEKISHFEQHLQNLFGLVRFDEWFPGNQIKTDERQKYFDEFFNIFRQQLNRVPSLPWLNENPSQYLFSFNSFCGVDQNSEVSLGSDQKSNENNFPMKNLKYMRVGSGYIHPSIYYEFDKDILQKFIAYINEQYDLDTSKNNIIFEGIDE